MFVDHLLFAVGGQDHGEGVKSGDIAPHLKAVHQEHGDAPVLPADLGEENLLEVVGLLHM